MSELTPYDASYPRLYAVEAARVCDALDNVVAVEHVGSTAVPGLAGKPTIDLAVGVPTLDLLLGAGDRMERLGYVYSGDHGLAQHVFSRGRGVPWRFIVHVVVFDGELWHDLIGFRDHLRAHPDDSARYAALKRSLLRERDDWYRGVHKGSFIEPILRSLRAARAA